MFRSEQQKMRLYKANLKKEAVNNFKQGEALDEYLLYEKGIESQKTGLSKFAAAIGESIGENLGAREVKPVDKIKQWAAQTGDWTTQTASNPALDANIVARSNNMPKSIKQPAGPKPVVSTLSNLSAADDLALRERFLTVLNDMKNSVESTANERNRLDILMRLGERMRMDNLLNDIKNNARDMALVEKAFKNLKQLTANAKTNRIVAEKKFSEVLDVIKNKERLQKQREATAKSRAKWKGKIKLK